MILELFFTNSTGILTVLAACCFLIVTWIKYVRTQYRVFNQLGIPGPQPAFLFGNALDFANKFPLDLFTQWSKKHGSVYGYYEGLQPSLVVTCPDLAHEILVKKFQYFSSRPQHAPFLWEREDRSLQNLNGFLWKRQRQAVSGGMSGRSIREMFPHVQSITDELLDEIERTMSENPQGFRVDDLMDRYAVKVITQATLGYHSNAFSDEDDVTLRYMQVAHESASAENFVTGLARLFPSLTSALKPLDRKHKFWAGMLSKTAQEFVDLVKRDPQSACPVMRSLLSHSLPASTPDISSSSIHRFSHGNSYTTQTDLPCTEDLQKQRLDSSCDGKAPTTHKLSQNIREKSSHDERKQEEAVPNNEKGNPRLSKEDIVDQVMGLLNAGLGPLAVTMTFVLYCLATQEQEQERVMEEIANIASSEDTVTLEELKKMKVLERFILESMRIFPVAPGVTRECVEDCVLSERTFTQGMVVRIMSGVMYGQEEHFGKAKEFYPDRFVDGYTKHAWLPFGHGPRKCVAERFATLVFKLCTVRILQRFHVRATRDTQVPLQLALRPFLVPRDGVHVKFVARRSTTDREK